MDWIQNLKNGGLSKVSNTVLDIIDGNILIRRFFRKQYLLILLLVIFSILYIGSRFACERSMRRVREEEKMLIDRQYEYLTISTELTKRSRCSVIEDSVKIKIPDLQLSKKPSILID